MHSNILSGRITNSAMAISPPISIKFTPSVFLAHCGKRRAGWHIEILTLIFTKSDFDRFVAMLRLLILASLCAVIGGSLIPRYVLEYPESLKRLFDAKRETSGKEKEDERGVCKTDECKLIARIIKESMDESVDPCNNFYEYACGNWSNVNPQPDNKTEWSLWTMVQDRLEGQIKEIITSEPQSGDLFAVKLAKKWYKSCMDEDAIEARGVEPLLSTLWRHGGWPVIMEDGEWDEDVYNWQIVDDQFARLLGFNAFHDLRYGSITYDGNATIMISTPHLPIGADEFLPFSIIKILDSSDENNESGEGSQEKGSRERGQQQRNKEETEEETEEQTEEEGEEGEEEDNSDWNTAEEGEEEEGKLRKRKLATRRKHQRRLNNHVRRKHDKRRIANRHVAIGGTKKRTKRDVAKQKFIHRLMHHQLKEVNKHKVHHSVKAKLPKHGRLVHNKMNKNNKRKRNRDTDEDDQEARKKKRRIAKRLGDGKRMHDRKKAKHAVEKRVHNRKMKTKLNGKGRKVKVHPIGHHQHQRIANHKIHHSARKMGVLKHKQVSLANSTEDANNEIDISYDDEAEDRENNKVEDEDEDSNNNSNNEDSDADDEESSNNEDEDEDDDSDSDDDDDDDYDFDFDTEELEQLLNETKTKYRDYILNVSIILSRGRGIEIPKEQMLKDIDDLIDFIIKLGDISLVDEDEPLNMTLFELQLYYEFLGPITSNNKINWIRKVQKIFAEAGVDIDDDVEITVTCPNYLEQLQTLLNETPRRVLVNYIHWLFLSKAIIAAPRELTELADEWYRSWMSSTSRESQCLELVQLSNIAGYEYVQRYLKEDVAKTARDMIDDIQKEVEYQVKASEWMTEDMKHFILDKLVHMKNWIGYPEWYRNTTLVKRYFRGLTIGPSFYENILNYVRYMRWKSLREILNDDENDLMNNLLDPLELNAFFIPVENSIAITAVDLQSPFFALSRPWYVNFGIIGLVMGHEVNHGFDDSGRLYDREGNRIEWLSAMAQAYDKRAMCFVDQYNKYSVVKGENYTIENYGNQTIGENIADSMGLHTVFRAYKRRERECGKMDPALPGLEKFTNDQLFFLSFANLWCESEDQESAIRSAKYDVHSTARLRVIGPASNSEEFAKAFKCPVGSPMNPKRKCNIWE